MFAFRIARRACVKLFAIVGFMLALVGGALVGYSALTSGGLSPISIFLRLFESLLGLAAIIAGMIIYTGPMRFGGFIGVIGGIMLLTMTSFAPRSIPLFCA